MRKFSLGAALHSQYLFLPVLLLILQMNFTFANYDVVSKMAYQLEEYQNNSTLNTELQTINLKYYDSKYVKNFKIQFEFVPLTSDGNLFQTDNEGSGVRLELRPGEVPNHFKLLLQYRAWDGERIIAPEQSFNLNEKHLLNLEIDVNNRLKLHIDQTVIVDQRISKQDIRYKKFVLGAGLSASRIFYGEIYNPKLNLEIYDRTPKIPIEAIGILLVLILLFRLSRKVPKLQVSQISSYLLRDGPGILSTILIFSALNFQKPFAKFFGDDILNIWPIRSSDPITIFSESIGPMYRPLTELFFLLRYELHGLNLRAWDLGTKGLAICLVIYMYFFLRSKSKLKTFPAVLVVLAYSTSIQFQASAIWWASNGSQHLLSQILTVYLLTAVFDFFRDKPNQKSFNVVVFRSFLLALTSEIFLPVMVALPIALLLITRLKLRSKKNESAKRKKKSSFESNVKLAQISIWPMAIVTIFFYLYRTFVVEVSKVVAASSAANYDFQEISITKTVEQFFEYLLAFPGVITGIYFYDLGAGGGRLKNFSEYSVSLKFIVVLFALLSVFVFCLVISNSLQFFSRSALTNHGLNITLLLIFIVTLIVPSMVPQYQQLRWIQFPFLVYLLLISQLFEITKKKISQIFLLYIFLLGQIMINLLMIKENFGVILW